MPNVRAGKPHAHVSLLALYASRSASVICYTPIAPFAAAPVPGPSLLVRNGHKLYCLANSIHESERVAGWKYVVAASMGFLWSSNRMPSDLTQSR